MSPNDPGNTPEIPRSLKVLVYLSVMVAAAALGLYVWQFHFGLSTKHDVWGQFGDYVGGTLNPLFAFTALLALLYTIVLQSRELRHSTEQLAKSAEALEKQNVVLRKQSFEATFFQLLKLYNDVVQELHITLEESESLLGGKQVREVKHEDRQCLAALHNVLIHEHLYSVARGDSTEPRLQALDIAYQDFYAKYGYLIGHYFRTIYNIVKIVENSDMSDDQKRAYVNILRAQLSKYELGLLLYNCLSVYGRKKMLPLVRKYNLLKHLEDDVQLSPEDRDLVGEPEPE